MEDDPGAADDERTIELSSIAAIFPELILDPESPYDATLGIAVSPSPPLKIRLHQLAERGLPVLPTPPRSVETDEDTNAVAGTKRKAVQSNEDAAEDVHNLTHLPPLILHVHLPDGYPSTKPPEFELSTSPPWIPKTKLENMKADGMRLWQELGKDQVVFTYIDHLQQLAEIGFNLARDLHNDVGLSSDMKLALLDFDLKTKREVFEKETFNCGVCLEPKKGVHCHRLLLCSHVFCVPCLQDFYNNCINEGDVDNVKCLTPNCAKEVRRVPPGDGQTPLAPVSKRKKVDRTLDPSELLQIPIEQELVQRYVRLKRKKRLESDKNTIYCPRQWCQGAARSEKHPKPIDPLNDTEEATSDSEVEDPAETAKKSKKSRPEDIPMSERLCICEDCDFAFCSVCKKGWHGELAVCNPRRQHELNEEERASLEYLKMHTTACPTCSAPAQKTMGVARTSCQTIRIFTSTISKALATSVYGNWKVGMGIKLRLASAMQEVAIGKMRTRTMILVFLLTRMITTTISRILAEMTISFTSRMRKMTAVTRNQRQTNGRHKGEMCGSKLSILLEQEVQLIHAFSRIFHVLLLLPLLRHLYHLAEHVEDVEASGSLYKHDDNHKPVQRICQEIPASPTAFTT
jgi:E3 ubiquitin-protein ligase RNF14